ncbi:pyridoxal kinase PdxY [Lichenicoccus sp.]|uniref:pyridoxal kinase PdxY n=1 Tax=Lichenicoccus sp. TaxID=2781899 RepID=UPI003D14B65F
MQSWVSFGHVGNAAALFALQRLGAEVRAVHTVQFSNHTGYGTWTGETFTSTSVRALLHGIGERGALIDLDAVLSGYLGDPDVGRAILDTVAETRARGRPELLYCCDPVMGDAGRGLFVRAGIPALLHDDAVPASDILTPNQFELERLTGLSCERQADLLVAVRHLQDRMRSTGPRLVLVTSVRNDTTPAASSEMIAASPAETYLLRTPTLAFAPDGAGDLIAALFLFHVLTSRDLRAALEAAASATWGVLEHTLRAGARELCLVAAQQQLVTPTRRFVAEPLHMT